jgi:hypothetical protein
MLLFTFGIIGFGGASGAWRRSLWTLPYLVSLVVALWLARLASANSSEQEKLHP